MSDEIEKMEKKIKTKEQFAQHLSDLCCQLFETTESIEERNAAFKKMIPHIKTFSFSQHVANLPVEIDPSQKATYDSKNLCFEIDKQYFKKNYEDAKIYFPVLMKRIRAISQRYNRVKCEDYLLSITPWGVAETIEYKDNTIYFETGDSRKAGAKFARIFAPTIGDKVNDLINSALRK
jgi:hypothetical protein